MTWKCVEHSFHLILIEFESHRLHFYKPTWQSGGMLIAMSLAIVCIHENFNLSIRLRVVCKPDDWESALMGHVSLQLMRSSCRCQKNHKKFHKCHTSNVQTRHEIFWHMNCHLLCVMVYWIKSKLQPSLLCDVIDGQPPLWNKMKNFRNTKVIKRE